MNPFNQIVTALAGRESGIPSAQKLELKSISRTGKIRDLLKSEARPMTAGEIAFDVDLPNFNTNLVWLLLKHDIAKGRVVRIGADKFEWSFDYESQHNTRIRAAIKLLAKNGYTVAKQANSAATGETQ